MLEYEMENRRDMNQLGIFAGENIKTENVSRMLKFYTENNSMTGNKFYKHKKVHQITFEVEGINSEMIIDILWT